MSYPHRPFRLVSLLSALAVVFTLAACDDDGGGDDDADGDDAEQAADDSGVAEDPATALTDAVAAMGDWDGVELSMAFEADDAARESLVAESPDDAEMVDTLLGASMRMVAVGDGDSGAVEFAATVDGTAVFELHMAATGETVDDLALRVDLPAITELADDPSMESEFDMLVSQASMFGLGEAAEALVAGEWVALTGLEEFASTMEGELGDDAAEDGPDEAQLEDAVQELADRTEALVEDVEVSHVGSDDAGEQLRVVADGAALQSYLEDISEVMAANELVDGMSQEEATEGLDELSADDEITFDVWISGGQVSQFAVDLGGVEDAEIDGEFLLIVGMSEHTGDLSAPSAAATVDVMETFGAMMGGFGGEGDAFGLGDDELTLEDDDLGGGDGESDDLGSGEDGGDDLGSGDDLGLGEDLEDMSQEDIDMMLSFMDCITEEDLEGFRFIMPEVAEAAEQALEDGTLEYCD